MRLTDRLSLASKLSIKRFLSRLRAPVPGEQFVPERKHDTQVIVFDDLIPTPDRDAGSARMMYILRALAERHHTVFIATGGVARPEYEKQLWDAGIETASALDFRHIFQQRDFVAAILSRPDIAGPLIRPIRKAAPGVKIIYDMLDVHHLRATREAELTGDPAAIREAERYRGIETRTARLADEVWCGSEIDQEIMRSLVPGVSTAVVPTVHELRPPGPAADTRSDLVFVGSYAHRPNVDSVRYLATEVMPLIRRTLPSVGLNVVGGGAPPDFADYAKDGVRALGYVPDIDPVLHGARVFVAPIRYGSGVNGKIGEALAYGLPVVTTTIGAEGWSFTHGEQVLIADDSASFAEAVVRLYTDNELWNRLSEAGRRHIKAGFTPEVIGKVVTDSLTFR